MTLKTIFKPSVPVATSNASTSPASAVQSDSSAKHDGETFHNWGLRFCAMVNASQYSLVPSLQRVYNYMYSEQVNNINLQEQQKQNIRGEITQKQTDIEQKKNAVSACQSNIETAQNKILECQQAKTEIKNKAYEVNKEAKIKLIIGLVILIPLTIYLFLFYSSTFYSAFFKDFSTGENVLNAMFDAQALSHSIKAGISEFFFVLCAPVIFLGLGFALHFFAKQNHWTKYLKMSSIVCVTFTFDAILAYMIGKHLHEMEIIIGTKPLGTPYGITEAISDPNTWAVIFCGFIVYIIWGIVFDMSMSAYNQLDLNKVNLNSIDQQIQTHQNTIQSLRGNMQSLQTQIIRIQGEINGLTNQLNQNVIIDKNSIRKEMTNFFGGWMAQMGVLGKSNAAQQQAHAAFNQTIQDLLN